MRRWIRGLGCFVFLLAVGGVVYLFFGPWGKVAGSRLADALQKNFQATVSYASLSGNPFRGFIVQDVHLKTASGLSLSSATLKVSLLPKSLLFRPVRVKTVTVIGGTLSFQKTKEGRMSWNLPPSETPEFTLEFQRTSFSYEDETFKVKFPLSGMVNGKITFAGQRVQFSKFSFLTLGTTFTLDGVYYRNSDDYKYQVEVHNLSVADTVNLLKAFLGEVKDLGIGANVDGRWTAERRSGVIHLSGTMETPKAYIHGWMVTSLQGKFSYALGKLSFQDVSAEIFGGKVQLKEGSLDFQSLLSPVNPSDTPNYTLNLSFDSLSMKEFLKSVNFGEKLDVSGKVAGEISFSGVLGDLYRSQGKGRISFTEGDFPSPDGKGRMAYDRAIVEFSMEEGVMKILKGQMAIGGGRWFSAAKGDLNFLSDEVDGRGILALPTEDVALLLGGEKEILRLIPEFILKQKVHLILWVRVKGQFARPTLAFDLPGQFVARLTTETPDERMEEVWKIFLQSKISRE